MEWCPDCRRRLEVLAIAVQCLERRMTALEGLAPGPVKGADVLGLLRARGWTQKDLAQRAGLSATNVNRWLAGQHACPVSAAVKMARALGVSVEVLWG